MVEFSSEVKLALLVIVGAVLSITILSRKTSLSTIPVGFPTGTPVDVTWSVALNSNKTSPSGNVFETVNENSCLY